ncbi:MAG: shikimate dehydrogenase [Rhodospirillales bacterium]|jgi:shikimate dehydrogenase|nr:shikimate dehydrogenase [Rhodospirillales bacterium]
MAQTGRTKLAAVIGWPVGHSISPRLHGYWLSHHGVDGAYVPLAVRPGDLAETLRLLPRIGFVGFNVTVPHKQAVLALVDEADPEARAIGAVNTVIVETNGRLRGKNTDAFGFLQGLRSGFPDWDPGHGPVVVIGAGGASRAVCAALVGAGVSELRLVNRTEARAEGVARDIGDSVTCVPWRRRGAALEGAALVVNTTTQGMTGESPLDLDLAALPTAAAVMDIVYAPLETPLLADARARGNRVIDGLGMILHQGRPGFAAWFGAEPEVTEELRRYILAGLDDGK